MWGNWDSNPGSANSGVLVLKWSRSIKRHAGSWICLHQVLCLPSLHLDVLSTSFAIPSYLTLLLWSARYITSSYWTFFQRRLLLSWLTLMALPHHVTFLFYYCTVPLLSGKEYACQRRRRGFNRWVGEMARRRKWQSTPLFLPGKSMNRGAWRATVPDVT